MENWTVRRGLTDYKREKINKQIGVVDHMVLSLNCGLLLTVAFCLLFFLALIESDGNSSPGWEYLNDMVRSLWSPALECSRFFWPAGVNHGVGFIYLIG